jgi:hypothetical protein
MFATSMFILGFSWGWCLMCCWAIFSQRREHRESMELFDKLFAIVQKKLGPTPSRMQASQPDELPSSDYDL